MVAAIDLSENLALRSESSFIYTPQVTHVVASEIMVETEFAPGKPYDTEAPSKFV
jgi:hypothetical protein